MSYSTLGFNMITYEKLGTVGFWQIRDWADEIGLVKDGNLTQKPIDNKSVAEFFIEVIVEQGKFQGEFLAQYYL